jgi:hypothetical protein
MLFLDIDEEKKEEGEKDEKVERRSFYMRWKRRQAYYGLVPFSGSWRLPSPLQYYLFGASINLELKLNRITTTGAAYIHCVLA